MRGICCGMLALAVVVATAPEAAAQERGESSTVDKSKHKDKKSRRTGKRSRRSRRGSGVEIDVRSDPRGAQIVVDGERMGKAPLKVNVPTGHRTIEARLSGHASARIRIDVSKGMGYLVFSLAREVKAPKVAKKESRRPGFGAKGNLSHSAAMTKARRSLKKGDHSDALIYAEVALSKKSSDSEAQMIATIAACGVGDKSAARRHLPSKRGSYREIAIRRCGNLGIDLP